MDNEKLKEPADDRKAATDHVLGDKAIDRKALSDLYLFHTPTNR